MPRTALLWSLRLLWIGIVAAVIFGTLPTHRAVYANYSAVVADELRAAPPANFGLPLDLFVTIRLICLYAIMIVPLSVGLYIFWRRSGDALGLLTAAFLAAVGLSANPVASVLRTDPFWFTAFGLINGAGYVFVYLFMITFPDGAFYPRWTRWLVIPLIASELFRNLTAVALTENPLLRIALFMISWSIIGVGVYAQVRRYRQIDDPLQRQQVKWVVLGVGALFFGVIVALAYLFVAYQTGGLPLLIGHLLILPIFGYGGALALETLIGLSVLRYGLLQVDRVINRSLVFAALTVTLGLLFVFSLYAISQIFITLTDSQQPPFTLAGAALVIGVLFNPLRRRVQRLVDQRLFGWIEKAKPLPVLTGRTLGVYEVGDLIGRGGMGEVYQAKHPTLGRAVAIKVLAPALARKDEFRARFEREARVVAGLRHPNIVTVHDFGAFTVQENDHAYYMVMEYIDGATLDDLLLERKVLPLDEVLPLIDDVAAALDAAHDMGLVHRDVKPSNVMLQRITAAGGGRRAILTDFGIARLTDSGTGLTQTGMIGTLDYAAPEQIAAAKTADRRADVYALGVMTFEMLTGRLPFEGSPAEIVFAHLQQTPPDPRTFKPDLPDAAAQAILQALSKPPEDRFERAGAFAAALRGG